MSELDNIIDSFVINGTEQEIDSFVVNGIEQDIDSIFLNGVEYVLSEREIDLLNVTWADHAITCGQDTNSYNAWSPHNLQYDEVNNCFVFLQCHANRHLSHTCTNWTLSIINPYDSTDYTDITIPSFNGLGMLFIENGTWTLLPRGGSAIYQSSDMGVTWETISASVPTYLFGVYKCGDTYFGGNDSNNEITYYQSSDLKTWTTKSFNSSLGYSILCETSFYEYGGKWWAFNRTNDSTLGHPVILQSTDNGATWTLFSDQELHGYRSTISCYPFKDWMVVADIDRDNGILYYNKFDGTTFTQLYFWKMPFAGDDFHNVNIASNYEDTVILEFMHATSGFDITYGGGNTYTVSRACDNVMIVGSTKNLPSLKFNRIETTADMVAYFNANCTTGLNSQRTYSWDLFNNWIRCKFGETTLVFDDEVEIPLNLISVNTGTNKAQNLFLKNGSSYAKAWNNTVTNPSKDNDRNVTASTAKQGFVNIKGIRYVFGYNDKRGDAFPVLTRQEHTININNIVNPTTSQNSVIGETWQESLGFRRVVSINLNTSSVLGSFTYVVQKDNFESGQTGWATLSYETAVNT